MCPTSSRHARREKVWRSIPLRVLPSLRTRHCREAKYPTEKVMKLLDWCLAKVEIYFPSHRSEMHWGISRGGRRGRAVRLILDASFCKSPPSWKVGRVVPA